jgi:hypothetical protein
MIRLLKRSLIEPENPIFSEPEENFDEEEYPVEKRQGMVRLLRSPPSN